MCCARPFTWVSQLPKIFGSLGAPWTPGVKSLLITDKTAGLEAVFKAELTNPIDCSPYKKKESPPTSPTHQPDQTAR